MPVTARMYLIVLPLVFLAAFIDSIAGGGGLISLPAYLLAGLPMQLASGSNKGSAFFGLITATLRYAKDGKISYREAGLAAVGAIPGAMIGAQLLLMVQERTARWILVVLLPVVAVFLLTRRPLRDEAVDRPRSLAMYAACVAIGLFVGAYDGFFGPGTGTFLILLFSWVCGMGSVTACGSAKLVNMTSNIIAMAMFARSGKVLWALSLPSAACAIAGGYLGSSLAIKKGTKLIRPVLVGVLGLILVKLAVDLATGNGG